MPKIETKPVPAPPKDRRLPLLSAKFRVPVPVPGCPVRALLLVSHAEIPNGDGRVCPQLFLDPDLRVIAIGDILIPFDGSMVESVIRARAAKS